MESGAQFVRMSLSAVAEADRPAMLRDVCGPALNMELGPLDDGPPRFDCDILALPGATILAAANSAMTTHWLSAEGASDEFALTWSPSAGRGRLRHTGLEYDSEHGEALLTSGRDPVDTVMGAGLDPVMVRIGWSALTAAVPDATSRLMAPITPDNAAMRLLNAYLGALRSAPLSAGPKLAGSVALHLRDLVALAIGGGDESAVAHSAGGRAGRLAAAKAWTRTRLRDPALTVQAAAAAQRISPRYLQMLFEADGETFSGFVLHERLELAHAALRDPLMAARSISGIAYEAGFGDLSYFNRSFRAAFGGTPSDIRERAVRAG